MDAPHGVARIIVCESKQPLPPTRRARAAIEYVARLAVREVGLVAAPVRRKRDSDTHRNSVWLYGLHTKFLTGSAELPSPLKKEATQQPRLSGWGWGWLLF